nr:hypothetical protein B0A51_14288 [Rachicladosporium sp. CCFEE 5018]
MSAPIPMKIHLNNAIIYDDEDGRRPYVVGDLDAGDLEVKVTISAPPPTPVENPVVDPRVNEAASKKLTPELKVCSSQKGQVLLGQFQRRDQSNIGAAAAIVNLPVPATTTPAADIPLELREGDRATWNWSTGHVEHVVPRGDAE